MIKGERSWSHLVVLTQSQRPAPGPSAGRAQRASERTPAIRYVNVNEQRVVRATDLQGNQRRATCVGPLLSGHHGWSSRVTENLSDTSMNVGSKIRASYCYLKRGRRDAAVVR